MLGLLRVEAAEGAIVELGVPGAVRFAGDDCARLHLAVSGPMTLELADASEPIRIDEGGYAIVLGRRSHIVADAPGRPAEGLRYLQEDHQPDQLPIIHVGGPEPRSRVLSCAFSIDPSGRAVLDVLPELLVVGSTSSTVQPLLHPGALAALIERPGGAAMMVALTELCLAQAASAALMEIAAPEGPPAILGRRQISAAVKMVRERPSDKWTVARLAAAVGMSRSSFASAFRHHVGKPPAEYVAGTRMRFAAAMLISERSLVSEVARSAGYDSDSSFIRAFKKRFGAAPSEFRKAVRPEGPPVVAE